MGPNLPAVKLPAPGLKLFPGVKSGLMSLYHWILGYENRTPLEILNPRKKRDLDLEIHDFRSPGTIFGSMATGFDLQPRHSNAVDVCIDEFCS